MWHNCIDGAAEHKSLDTSNVTEPWESSKVNIVPLINCLKIVLGDKQTKPP